MLSDIPVPEVKHHDEPIDRAWEELRKSFQQLGLSPIDRAKLLKQFRTDHPCSVIELAKRLDFKQPRVSKILSFNDLIPDAQAQLHQGKLDSDKAVTIASVKDEALQRMLLEQSAVLNRNQLRQLARGNEGPSRRAWIARFAMPGHLWVVVQGKQFTLSDAIDLLRDTIRELKRGRAVGRGICEQVKVMRSPATNDATPLSEQGSGQ